MKFSPQILVFLVPLALPAASRLIRGTFENQNSRKLPQDEEATEETNIFALNLTAILEEFASDGAVEDAIDNLPIPVNTIPGEDTETTEENDSVVNESGELAEPVPGEGGETVDDALLPILGGEIALPFLAPELTTSTAAETGSEFTPVTVDFVDETGGSNEFTPVPPGTGDEFGEFTTFPPTSPPIGVEVPGDESGEFIPFPPFGPPVGPPSILPEFPEFPGAEFPEFPDPGVPGDDDDDFQGSVPDFPGDDDDDDFQGSIPGFPGDDDDDDDFQGSIPGFPGDDDDDDFQGSIPGFPGDDDDDDDGGKGGSKGSKGDDDDDGGKGGKGGSKGSKGSKGDDDDDGGKGGSKGSKGSKGDDDDDDDDFQGSVPIFPEARRRGRNRRHWSN